MLNVIPKLSSYRASGKQTDLRDYAGVTLPEEWSALGGVAEQILFSKYKPNGVKKIDIVTESALPTEGYRLILSENMVFIAASTCKGALYALETLRVMAKVDSDAPEFILNCAEINDAPRFRWRGLHFDEARHFFGKDAVKRLLDLMAMHKLNRLHWHLTDDQGWRIEIKKYPKLTEIGAFRQKSNIHGWSSYDDDGTPHGGFYKADEISEIVRYAAALGIEIVPEIDMPAHFTAAFAAYPELACRNVPTEVAWYFGGAYAQSIDWKDWNRSACVGKDATMQFIRDVIDEVVTLFPAPYFHIGGDEAPKDEWKTCPDCQRVMKEKGLEDENALQGWFTNGVNEYVKSKGKRLIGWNEVLAGGNLDNSVIVQYWTPGKDKRVAKHVKDGGEIIMSNHRCFYFDMPFAQYPLKNTYGYRPNMAGLSKKQESQVLGVEGEVWTEWITDMNKAEFQTFPRMEALAEVGWSDGKKNYKEFLTRLRAFLPILDGMHVNYAEDVIADPRGAKHRQDFIKRWYHGEEDCELLENDKLKAKKK